MRRCADCRYFDNATRRARDEVSDLGVSQGLGLCRFNAPERQGWPRTTQEDWCGEWTAPRTRDQAGENPDTAKVDWQAARQVDMALFKEDRR